MFGKKTVCCVVLNGDSPLILLLIRLRSLSPRSALGYLSQPHAPEDRPPIP